MDVAAANAILDSWLGDNHAAQIPDQFELALFTGHPDDEGSDELDTTGGYTRVLVANTTAVWPAAEEAQKVSEIITAPGTGDYNAEAPYWRLYDPATGTAWFTGEFDDAVFTAGADMELPIALTEDLS